MTGINLSSYSTQNKKRNLWELIKLIAEHWDEKDKNFIAEYAQEVFNIHGLEKALECFEDLAEQTKWVKPEDFRK